MMANMYAITGLAEFNAFIGQKSQVSVILEAFEVILSGDFLTVSSDIKTLFHLNRIHSALCWHIVSIIHLFL